MKSLWKVKSSQNWTVAFKYTELFQTNKATCLFEISWMYYFGHWWVFLWISFPVKSSIPSKTNVCS